MKGTNKVTPRTSQEIEGEHRGILDRIADAAEDLGEKIVEIGEDIKDEIFGDSSSDSEDDELDLLQIPPDFEIAKKHGLAHRIRKTVSEVDPAPEDLCPCCYYQVSDPTIPVCSPITEINELGSGFPLYFQYIKFWSILMGIMFAVQGIYSLIENLSADRGDVDKATISDSYVMKTSFGNYVAEYNYDTEGTIQPLLNVIMMVVFIIGFNILRGIQVQTERKIDADVTSPADYTIWVRGFPITTREADLKEFFTKFGKPNGETEILKINFAYDIGEFIQARRKRDDLIQKKRAIELFMMENDGELPEYSTWYCTRKEHPHPDELAIDIQDLNQKIKEYEKSTEVGVGADRLVGHAFLTFRSQSEADEVDKLWDRSTFHKLVAYVKGKSCGKKINFFFQGKFLQAERGPEPTDILWENLGISLKERFLNSAKTAFYTILLLGVCFAVIFLTTYWQDSVNDSIDEDDQSSTDRLQVITVSLTASMVIIGINAILSKLIRVFTNEERRITYTDYNLSVATKLTVALFVNTGIITLAINNNYREDWFTSGGLIEDAFYILLSNAVVPGLLSIFDPFYAYRVWKRGKELKKGDRSKMTQIQANQLFEGPLFDIAQKYANLMKTILITAAYAPIIPLASLICLVALLFTYWADKFVLLTRHTRPNTLGDRLNTEMTQAMPLVVLLYASSNFFFFTQLNEETWNRTAFIGLVIAFGYLLLPVQSVMSCLQGRLEDRDPSPFEEAELEFLQDYDRENPVTSAKASAAWIKTLTAKMGATSENVKAAEIFMGITKDAATKVSKEGESQLQISKDANEVHSLQLNSVTSSEQHTMLRPHKRDQNQENAEALKVKKAALRVTKNSINQTKPVDEAGNVVKSQKRKSKRAHGIPQMKKTPNAFNPSGRRNQSQGVVRKVGLSSLANMKSSQKSKVMGKKKKGSRSSLGSRAGNSMLASVTSEAGYGYGSLRQSQAQEKKRLISASSKKAIGEVEVKNQRTESSEQYSPLDSLTSGHDNTSARVGRRKELPKLTPKPGSKSSSSLKKSPYHDKHALM